MGTRLRFGAYAAYLTGIEREHAGLHREVTQVAAAGADLKPEQGRHRRTLDVDVDQPTDLADTGG